MTVVACVNPDSDKELYDAVYPIVTRNNKNAEDVILNEYIFSSPAVSYDELKNFINSISWHLVQYIQTIDRKKPLTLKACYVDYQKYWILILDFEKHHAELKPVRPGLVRNMRSCFVRTTDGELTLLLALAGRREREEAAAAIRGATA